MGSHSIFKLSMSFCNLLRLFPHCFCYLLVKKKIKEDVLVALEHHEMNQISLFVGWLYLMTWDKWYRNIFYYRVGFLRYLISWLCPPCDSFVIGTYAEIGEGLLGVHPYSTYLNARKIGNNFVVKNCVTIGNKGINEKPIIGDNVEINVNSVVFGDITIGNNVIIGAGTVLNKSVPDNAVVVGNPARIIKMNGQKVNIEL